MPPFIHSANTVSRPLRSDNNDKGNCTVPIFHVMWKHRALCNSNSKTYIPTHARTHAPPRARAHTHTHPPTRARTNAHLHAHTHKHTHAHAHAHTHVRTCTRAHTHTHTNTHTRTHTHTHSLEVRLKSLNTFPLRNEQPSSVIHHKGEVRLRCLVHESTHTVKTTRKLCVPSLTSLLTFSTCIVLVCRVPL